MEDCPMFRSRAAGGRFAGGFEKCGRITYKRYAGAQTGESAYAPLAVAVFAAVAVLSCCFLWETAFRGVSAAAEKPLAAKSVERVDSPSAGGYFIQLAGAFITLRSF
jgi:hypothetical protein